MLHPVLATMLLHLQRLCTLPELSWREDKEDNWEALLQGDLQRRYDTRVGRCFQTVCVFCPLTDWQPRVQLKKAHASGSVVLSDPESVTRIGDKFVVKPKFPAS